MRRKEMVVLPGFWPWTARPARGREKTGNQKLMLFVFLASVASYPFFLPLLAAWMFWWIK